MSCFEPVNDKPMTEDPVALTQALIRRPSVTPDDAGCQRLLADLLLPLGCEVRWVHGGAVSNLMIKHGRGSPHLMFLGHTDVVPAGDEQAWRHPPFASIEEGGCLYGRGAADMKAAVAAMVVAMQGFIQDQPGHKGTLSLLITSDEEGPAEYGVRQVAPLLNTFNLLPDYCLVGEPSSQQQFGDTVRIGRRGSIHGRCLWRGNQGHTAYLDSSENPVHRALSPLAELANTRFDEGDDAFPPTGLHFVRVNADSGASNVTPGQLEAAFNIRNNPMSSAVALKQRIENIFVTHNARPDDFHWQVNGEPFRTAGEAFLSSVTQAIQKHTGISPEANTGGGTSDGRFLAPLGVEVVEFGLLNDTIHQVNENTPIVDIQRLTAIYSQICRDVVGR